MSSSWMERTPKRIYVTTTGMMISPYKSNLNPNFERLHSYQQYGRRWPTPVSGYYKRKEHVYACSMMDPVKVKERFFGDYAVEYLPSSEARDIYPAEMNDDFAPRDQQQAFIEEALYYQGKGCHRIFNNMQTGLGKTVATIYMILENHKKTLILTAMTQILDQWVEAFKQFTDMPEKRIWICTRSSDLIDAIADPMVHNDIDIFLITHALLASLVNKVGWYGVSQIVNALGIGTKVFDEAHMNLESMVCLDAFTSVEHTYYLTADFNQSSNAKGAKYHRIFQGVPILPEEVENRTLKYVDVLSVLYNSHPSTIDRVSVFGQKGFSNHSFMRYQFTKPYLLQALVALINYLQRTYNYRTSGEKILVLTSLIEHSEQLHEDLSKMFPEYNVGLHNGLLSKEDRKLARDTSDIIVSTYSSIKQGIDVHGISCVITCDQVDRITDNQCAGRARPVEGKKALYVMLYDMGFDYCVRSKVKRASYLEQSKASTFYSINLEEMVKGA